VAPTVTRDLLAGAHLDHDRRLVVEWLAAAIAHGDRGGHAAVIGTVPVWLQAWRELAARGPYVPGGQSRQ